MLAIFAKHEYICRADISMMHFGDKLMPFRQDDKGDKYFIHISYQP